MDLQDLQSHLQAYRDLLAKTVSFRNDWPQVKTQIQTILNKIIEERGMKAPSNPIDIYVPMEITEELIINHVKEFLRAMLKWENLDARHNELGYNIKR